MANGFFLNFNFEISLTQIAAIDVSTVDGVGKYKKNESSMGKKRTEDHRQKEASECSLE